MHRISFSDYWTSYRPLPLLNTFQRIPNNFAILRYSNVQFIHSIKLNSFILYEIQPQHLLLEKIKNHLFVDIYSHFREMRNFIDKGELTYIP